MSSPTSSLTRPSPRSPRKPRGANAATKQKPLHPANDPKMSNVTMKRSVRVIPPEKQDGNTEYKRQIIDPTPTRLRTLATQMSYRLDEGKGTATYHVGVEDDGCHSLLDYSTVAESVHKLELLARSLNALVIKRKFVQREVHVHPHGIGGDNCEVRLAAATLAKKMSLGSTTTGDAKDTNDEKEEKSGLSEDAEDECVDKITPGLMTRCELTIQRVETHLLDPSPTSLESIASASSSTSTLDPAAGSALAKPSDQAAVGSNNVSYTLSQRNIRIAVVGNVDAGKSTLIGTLTTSLLDDGRGKSRTSIMKHRHEIESGRTSTATTHLMGFKSTGEAIAGRDKIRSNKTKSEDEIARESHRVITLMDLAGHEKYLKTTIHGVSSGMADYALILVNSRHPPTHMTQHHLNLCCSFGIPLIIILTKTDGCPEHALKTCKEEIQKLLRAPDVNKRAFAVREEKDVETCVGKLHTLAPILETSCVTGTGMNLLKKLLFSLPKRRKHGNKINRPFEFLVEDIFNVPGVGAVVSGFVNAGELTVGSSVQVFVGPTNDGTFLKTVAKSAHIARINTNHITSGQSACLAFSLNKDLRKKLRRGMVVLRDSPQCTREFDAEICVLKGEGTTIRKSYQAYVHILNVRQSAYARHIELVKNGALITSHAMAEDEDGVVLRPGCRAKVRFEFAKRPEYIRAGMRMLFRDGRVRGVGIVTGVPNMQLAN
mmetsp:Transcript_5549/g.7995  ORF Transcript_5549/g.7995 Transcript_5549/m.7995 type:complete len:714 (+) Transcript_5549:1019-3160(+)|eukprot:CAMPEP_0195539338 /NCGR_PEP_ID=MMETSP0794_2-20130614/50000_1 /TAXON_ID=515487 /ORGANISM="Stephanopyxis turris, Strain CCMP 815" /LENGTH=713 /DNA_ID=CAMNT_0040673363 /DNA_START=1470 /DNA_END=3611 /DNA_ORIENTATION=-